MLRYWGKPISKGLSWVLCYGAIINHLAYNQCDQIWSNFASLVDIKKTLAIMNGFI